MRALQAWAVGSAPYHSTVVSIRPSTVILPKHTVTDWPIHVYVSSLSLQGLRCASSFTDDGACWVTVAAMYGLWAMRRYKCDSTAGTATTSLPSDIRHIPSAHAFKTALKTHPYIQYKWFQILPYVRPRAFVRACVRACVCVRGIQYYDYMNLKKWRF